LLTKNEERAVLERSFLNFREPFLEYLQAPKQRIVFIQGSATCGKTFFWRTILSSLSRRVLSLEAGGFSSLWEALALALEKDFLALRQESHDEGFIWREPLKVAWKKSSWKKTIEAMERAFHRIQGSQYAPEFLWKFLKNCKESHCVVLENFHQISEEKQKALLASLLPFASVLTPFIIVATGKNPATLAQEVWGDPHQVLSFSFTPWDTEALSSLFRQELQERSFPVTLESKIVNAAQGSPKLLREILSALEPYYSVSDKTFILSESHYEETLLQVALSYGVLYKKRSEKLKRGLRNPKSLYAEELWLLQKFLQGEASVSWRLPLKNETVSDSCALSEKQEKRLEQMSLQLQDPQGTRKLLEREGEAYYFMDPVFLFYFREVYLKTTPQKRREFAKRENVKKTLERESLPKF
jgi:hypothetical protein